ERGTLLPGRMQDGCVVGIISGSQVATPRERDAFAEGLQLELSAGIEEPLVRAKRSAGIANSPNVHQRTGLHSYDSVAVYVLVCFPILQQRLAAQRRAPLAPVARADVAVHGQIGVGSESEHKEFVKGRLPNRPACAQPVDRLVVSALGLRKPLPSQPRLQFGEGLRVWRPQARQLRRRL